MAKDDSVRVYVPPLYNRMISGLSKYAGTSKSKIVAKAVEKFFDEMHPMEREKILSMDKTVS
jgi:predicted DNA-binding protein